MSNSFQWSLKPLLIVMKAIGMNLDLSNPRSAKDGRRIRRVIGQSFVLAIGFGLLASNLVINCMSIRQDLKIKVIFAENNQKLSFKIFHFHPNGGEIPRNQYMYQFFAGPLIEHLSQVVLVCGNHFSFFILALIVTNKWKNLWNTLMTIQQEMELSDLFYRKCRQRCLITLALLGLNAIIAFTVHRLRYRPLYTMMFLIYLFSLIIEIYTH